MDISKIDKNFAIKTAIDEPDVKWYSVLEEPFDIYGLYKTKEDGLFRRMPKEVAENIHSSTTGEINIGVKNLYTNTSGGRIRCLLAAADDLRGNGYSVYIGAGAAAAGAVSF